MCSANGTQNWLGSPVVVVKVANWEGEERRSWLAEMGSEEGSKLYNGRDLPKLPTRKMCPDIA